MAQRIEQGSVLGFVLVGAVLLGLLAGGIYVVRHMQSTDNTTTTKPTTPSKDNKNTADNGSSAPAKPSTTSNEDQLKAALDAQSKSKEESKKSDTSTSSSSTSANNSTSSAAALPKTGPEQVVGSMLGAAFLVASVVSYTRSRRLI